MKEQLIFVYNANSDWFSAVTDFAHKILSPPSYQCNLCALTYGSISMKQEWKSFIESLPIETVFLHKDEFEKQHKTKADLPATFVLKDGAIKEIIRKQEIEKCQSLKDLEKLVTGNMREYVQHYHSNI